MLTHRVVLLDDGTVRLEVRDKHGGLAIALADRDCWVSIGYSGRDRVWSYLDRRWNSDKVQQ